MLAIRRRVDGHAHQATRTAEGPWLLRRKSRGKYVVYVIFRIFPDIKRKDRYGERARRRLPRPSAFSAAATAHIEMSETLLLLLNPFGFQRAASFCFYSSFLFTK